MVICSLALAPRSVFRVSSGFPSARWHITHVHLNPWVTREAEWKLSLLVADAPGPLSVQPCSEFFVLKLVSDKGQCLQPRWGAGPAGSQGHRL